jgi:dihydrolipoamide dehydrogenase
VTVIEMLPKIAATLDGQVGRNLDRLLRKQGLAIRTKTRVTTAKTTAKQVKATVADGKGSEVLRFDRLLVAVGRRPNSMDLGLEDLGVALDENFQTNVAGIYAIGDLVRGPALAHKASSEGTAAVECIAGRAFDGNYDAIPAVVYTWPAAASVGLTEEAVKAQGIPYCVGRFPFSGAGRARCMGKSEGFVKLIAHGKADRIIGVHIIGPRAADMIAESALALEFGASSEDIARTVHGHPSFSEALMEAALAVRKCSIYAS